MLNGIAHASLDGADLDPDMAVNLASTVFLGGLDTLPSSIAWTFRYLAQNPQVRERLVQEPEVIPQAVEEFLRLFTVTPTLSKRVTRDIHFHGKDIREGEFVVPVVSLANLDSAEFNDPLVPDFDRRVNRHMAFAVGAHRCLGSHLARHELCVALEEWHRVIPDYEVDPRGEIGYTGGVLAMTSLPLRWETATS